MGEVKRYRVIGIDLPLVSEEDHDREIAARDARIADLELVVSSLKTEEANVENQRIRNDLFATRQREKRALRELEELRKQLSDPFRPRAGEVSDQILTHQEIQKAITEGNLRVAPESGIGTRYESGPGFVTVEYAAKVIGNRNPECKRCKERLEKIQ